MIAVLENITLEPVLFFVSFVGSMDSASLGQLVIDKSCHMDFNYTDEVCDNLLNKTNVAANKAVQDEVAQFKVIYVQLQYRVKRVKFYNNIETY